MTQGSRSRRSSVRLTRFDGHQHHAQQGLGSRLAVLREGSVARRAAPALHAVQKGSTTRMVALLFFFVSAKKSPICCTVSR